MMMRSYIYVLIVNKENKVLKYHNPMTIYNSNDLKVSHYHRSSISERKQLFKAKDSFSTEVYQIYFRAIYD